MSIMNEMNVHTNLPRPLSSRVKDMNMNQSKKEKTAPNYAQAGIEGGVLKTITKSKI